MKIYTKTGDKGATSLLGGTRVSKAHMRIEAYGTVDELNSYLGLLRDLDPAGSAALIQNIQDRLFSIGSSLAAENDRAKEMKPDLTNSDIESLEKAIDEMNEELPQMKNFIIPGGHVSVSHCHIARCICRRAERHVIRMADEEVVEPNVIMYLNRLSDYLFVLARYWGLKLDVKEIPWRSKG